MKPTESTPLLDPRNEMRDTPPAALLTPAEGGHDAKPIRLPQAIAHRGYKAAFPENSMAAFRSAVEIGAHAIETDLHLTRDGIVALSHDATLKRCFDLDKKVADCDWSYISTLLTVREPRQPMPRLVDLLEYLAQPEQEHMWVLLDIKRDDDPSELLGHVASAIASVPARKPWTERILIGCWNANYVKLSLELLPGFPLTFIGFDLVYANALFAVPNMNFNLLQHTVAGPCGGRFRRKARRNGRSVLVWSVREAIWDEWSIRNEVDGVITDDPKLFLEVCDRWRREHGDPSVAAKAGPGKPAGWTLSEISETVTIYFLLAVLLVTEWFKKGSSRKQVRKALGDIP